jgi:hypothetical protein
MASPAPGEPPDPGRFCRRNDWNMSVAVLHGCRAGATFGTEHRGRRTVTTARGVGGARENAGARAGATLSTPAQQSRAIRFRRRMQPFALQARQYEAVDRIPASMP